MSEYHPKLGAALESAVLQLARTDPCNTQMPEKKKKQIRNGKAVQASDATTTQQIKAAWSSAPLGSQKRPPLPRKKTFDAAKTNAAFDAYYRGNVVPEAEWVRFLEVMRSPLPTTFSFTDCSGQLEARLVQARFEKLLAACAAVDLGCDEVGRIAHWAAVDQEAHRPLPGALPVMVASTTGQQADNWLTPLMDLFANLTGGGCCVERKASITGTIRDASDAALSGGAIVCGGEGRRAVCVAAGGRVSLSVRARKGGVRA